MSSCHVYPLRLEGYSEDERDKVIQEIMTEGVSVNVHFQPLPKLTLFKSLGYDIDNYPVSNMLYSSEISLPVYPQMTDAQVERVIEVVDNVVRKRA